MLQGQATDADDEISLYVHRYTASDSLAGGAGGNVWPHGVDAPWGHQTAGRLAWEETFPTAGGRWQRAPHRIPTRPIPYPGAGAMWPRSAARPGKAQNVLPVFSQRSCLCVSCLGFLERAQQTEPGQRQRAVSPSSEGMASGVAKHLRLALLGRSVRHDAVDVFQIAIEIAAGGQQQTRVLLERLFIRVERLVKRIKLRILTIRLGINAGRFRVRLADSLLRFPVRLRAQAVQLALLLTTNLGAGPIPFGPVPRRNTPALRNHPFIDPLLHLTDIVDTLDPYIDELDAQRGQVLLRPFDH